MLSIGIVVDDAIVVVENVERNMAEFHLPRQGSGVPGMEEVTGPVIAIVLVLSAVFVPVWIHGRHDRAVIKQFAITIAISVSISGLVALTLKPGDGGAGLKAWRYRLDRSDAGSFRAFESRL